MVALKAALIRSLYHLQSLDKQNNDALLPPNVLMGHVQCSCPLRHQEEDPQQPRAGLVFMSASGLEPVTLLSAWL